MSCWCDGEDLACEYCRPDLSPRTRRAIRKWQDTRTALLKVAEGRADINELIAAANAYADAAEAYRDERR